MSRMLRCPTMLFSLQSSSSCKSFSIPADVSSCLIVFQNIVPISLYITIEIVKTVQAYLIFQDVEMYYDICECMKDVADGR